MNEIAETLYEKFTSGDYVRFWSIDMIAKDLFPDATEEELKEGLELFYKKIEDGVVE
jgi:hypothetical protein